MMKILTYEERLKEYDKFASSNVKVEECYSREEWLCQAQAQLTLQEVVAWLEEHNQVGLYGRAPELMHLSGGDWQKLKEMAKL